ncbi:hypothetical protein J3U99_20720 [Brucella pituitosa]|uniref:hypothetical protein n=1 Tax=Brucella pituitosa TaxID=571256 RepID=UPI0020067343|nr:hypothetical protein [Brucella pituitosa]MCK4207195.1 hypothetical protein [Brucella pituitosa]
MAHKETAIFRSIAEHDPAASKKAGRPIFKDIEVCELHFPGDKQHKPVFPAHSFAGWGEDENGNQEKLTYALKYNDQYLRFKEGKAQVAEGTPLSELPFLTEAKRMELKALKIYTAEQLAWLDGQNLKNLGQGGRSLKDQAQAYLDTASKSAGNVALADENAALRQRIAELTAELGGGAVETEEPEDATETDPATDQTDEDEDLFALMPDEDLKAYIKDKSGEGVRGTPKRETLLAMARELDQTDED